MLRIGTSWSLINIGKLSRGKGDNMKPRYKVGELLKWKDSYSNFEDIVQVSEVVYHEAIAGFPHLNPFTYFVIFINSNRRWNYSESEMKRFARKIKGKR
jgi:hypothetical protein